MAKNVKLVLNLIITGIPSILQVKFILFVLVTVSFKPYYNWNTFNTMKKLKKFYNKVLVLNLIITGIPSILGEIEISDTVAP